MRVHTGVVSLYLLLSLSHGKCVYCPRSHPTPFSVPPPPPLCLHVLCLPFSQDSICHGSKVETYDVQYLLKSHPEKSTSLSSATAHCALRNLTSATRYQAKVKVSVHTPRNIFWRGGYLYIELIDNICMYIDLQL